MSTTHSTHRNPKAKAKDKDNFNPADVIIGRQPRIVMKRTNPTPTTLLDEINALSSEANKKIVLPIRDLYPGPGYDKAKTTQTPCYFPSIDFEGEQTYIGCLDIDRKKNPSLNWDKTKELLSLLPWVMVCAYSLSGDGLFILFRYSAGKNHEQAIQAGIDELLLFGIVCDSLKEINRFRAQSYDPTAYINYNVVPLDFEEIAAEPKAEKPTKKDNFSNDEIDLTALSTTTAEDYNQNGLDWFNENVAPEFFDISEHNKAEFSYKYHGSTNADSMLVFTNGEAPLFHIHSDTLKALLVANGAPDGKSSFNLYDSTRYLQAKEPYILTKELNVAGYGSGEFHESNKNAFPIEVFPEVFRAYANDTQDTLNFPLDYIGSSILTVVSTATGANVVLEVKKDWLEPANIYVCLVGAAGANKSHPIDAAFQPIEATDKKRYAAYKRDMQQYDMYLALSKTGKQKQVDDLNEIGENLPTEPTLELSILKNFTTEALYRDLTNNPNGLCIVSDEITGFTGGMNNYSKTDQTPIYLSFYSGKSISVSRAGGNRMLRIDNPFLSVIGGIQPRMLNTAFSPDKLSSGFFQRFLFSYPNTADKKPISDTEASPELAEKYRTYIYELMNISEPRTLLFTAEAKQYFYSWQAKNCERVNENQNSIKAEILTKYDNHFLRLSILLQMMRNVNSERVELEAVKGAENLCSYYLSCAFRVLEQLRDTGNYLSSLPNDKQEFYNSLGNEFTTSEALEIGEDLEIKERSVMNLLKDVKLFKKIKHGNYTKIKK